MSYQTKRYSEPAWAAEGLTTYDKAPPSTFSGICGMRATLTAMMFANCGASLLSMNNDQAGALNAHLKVLAQRANRAGDLTQGQQMMKIKLRNMESNLDAAPPRAGHLMLESKSAAHTLTAMAILAAAITLVGCASSTPSTSHDQHITRPEIGTVQTREVGEPLFETIVARTYDGIKFPPGTRIEDQVSFTIEPTGPFVLTSPPGSSDERYCGPIIAVHNVWGDLNSPMQNYCIAGSTLRERGTKFTRGAVTKIEADNFKRQLLYEGTVGNALRLSYREFKGDFARPAFAQDLTFDLSNGKVVGVKGSRIEVLDVNNLGIRYKVLHSFSD